MRTLIFFASIFAAACGGSHSGNKPDAAPCGGCDAPNDGTSGGGTTITLTLTNHPTNAAMFSFVVAYQDGSGPWTVAPAPNGDTYTFTVNSAAYGIAWTCVNGTLDSREVNMEYFAVAERTSITQVIPARCNATGTLAALTGAVTNPPAAGTLDLAWGGRRVTATRQAGGGLGYSIDGIVPPQTHDLIAGNNSLGGGVGVTDIVTTSAKAIARGLAVTGATTQAVDYSNAPATTSAAVTNVPAGAAVTTDLVTANGTVFTLVRQTGAQASYLTKGLDATQQATGDIYNQQVHTAGNGSSSTTQNWTTTIAALAYTAPPALGGATSSVTATTPYPLIKTTWNAYTSTIGYTWVAEQPVGGNGCAGIGPSPNCIVWTVDISPGVAGGSPQEQMPDLSMLTGWDPKLQFVPGTAVNGEVIAATSSLGASDFPVVGAPATAATRAFAGSGWSVTP